MKTSDEIKALVADAFSGSSGGFRPCAFFDEGLDCIRVIVRDCSTLEERISDRVTVLLDNYYPGPGRRQYAGFTIKGARHFCLENNISLEVPVKISDILNVLMARSPEIVVQWFVDQVAKPLVQEGQIEDVEVPAGLEPRLA